ncbi:hypothetical protein AB0A95_33365 [Micromonospora sp. NPDC049230]|uniref:hypothetical protein n=1 Tax=Micromonospora sp. NPDC049230 TaxID=3155502 RepID=UPI0033E59C3F
MTGHPFADALEADEISRLTRIAAEMDQVVDRVVAGARLHTEAAADQADGRPSVTAMLSRDLRRVIDASPEFWALLVADLALQVVEGHAQDVRELEP